MPELTTDPHKACNARPHATLLEELLDVNVPKSEREWAAVKEIERLQHSDNAWQVTLDAYRSNEDAYEKRHAQDTATIDTLKAALEGYANPENWRDTVIGGTFDYWVGTHHHGYDLAAATLAEQSGGDAEEGPERVRYLRVGNPDAGICKRCGVDYGELDTLFCRTCADKPTAAEIAQPERIYISKHDMRWFPYSGVTHDIEYVRAGLLEASQREVAELTAERDAAVRQGDVWVKQEQRLVERLRSERATLERQLASVLGEGVGLLKRVAAAEAGQDKAQRVTKEFADLVNDTRQKFLDEQAARMAAEAREGRLREVIEQMIRSHEAGGVPCNCARCKWLNAALANDQPTGDV